MFCLLCINYFVIDVILFVKQITADRIVKMTTHFSFVFSLEMNDLSLSGGSRNHSVLQFQCPINVLVKHSREL